MSVILAAFAIPFVLLCVMIFDLLLAWPLLWSWNYVIPGLFKLPTLDYWHAFALLIVATLLVKGSSSSSSK